VVALQLCTLPATKFKEDIMNKFFKLDEYGTSVRKEILAGVITFLAISYVLFVHPIILADAGVPTGPTLIATIAVSVISSLLMGLYANVPIVVAPAMGVNAFFTYTMVQNFGMSWQEALGVVIIAGVIFAIIVFSGILENFGKAIPLELTTSITVGIGLFLVRIGLENSGFLLPDGLGWSWIGAIGIVLLILLGAAKVKGSFLIAIIALTIIYWLLNPGQQVESTNALTQLPGYVDLITSVSFAGIFSIEAIIGIFSLVMILIFEAIGMFEAFVPDQKRRNEGYKVAAVGGLLSGILGTSSAIPVAENGAGVKEGGRTGLTAVTAAVLFILALFATPLFAYIPSEAVGPVIIFTGLSMGSAIQGVDVDHWAFWLPVLLVVILIPLTGSIVDGMAYGFIAYPIVALITGRKKGLNPTIWVIAILFLLMLITNAFLV